jgi:hypothetical protein
MRTRRVGQAAAASTKQGTIPTMRVAFSLGVALALTTTFAAADPPPAPPTAEDGVAAAVVGVVDARARRDASALRALIKLPLRITWNANNGQGDCSVARSKTLTDPLKAASALSLDSRFVAVMRRDKGHAHRGTGCEEASSTAPFTLGEPAIKVVGDQATVHYDIPVCEAGAPQYTLTLLRVAGVWSVVGYDSGCHYDES